MTPDRGGAALSDLTKRQRGHVSGPVSPWTESIRRAVALLTRTIPDSLVTARLGKVTSRDAAIRAARCPQPQPDATYDPKEPA